MPSMLFCLCFRSLTLFRSLDIILQLDQILSIYHEIQSAMRKGNGERRIDEKGRKTKANTSTRSTNGEAVRAKLLKLDATEYFQLENARVWCKALHDSIVCYRWFRGDCCDNKKCKLPHAGASVSTIDGVPFHETENEEFLCSEPVRLLDLPARDAKLIQFVAIDARCIYDYRDMMVWDSWLVEYASLVRGASAGCGAVDGYLEASSINMKTDIIGSICHKVSSFCMDSYTRTAPSICESTWEVVIPTLLEYLPVKEMVYFCQSSKIVKQICLRNDQFRLRRKEAFSLVAGDFSKVCNLEKKKKQKQANQKKVAKKDAYARGGNDGR
jgi:hypothetical protein